MCEGACGGQKRVLYPLELELRVFVSCLVWVLETESKFSIGAVSILDG